MSTNTTDTTAAAPSPATLTLYQCAPPVAALDQDWLREFCRACSSHAPPNYRRGDAERVLTAAALAALPWGQIIIDAERRGGFSLYDEARARCWTACAVGVAQAPVEMLREGWPADAPLTRAGDAFAAAVDANDYLRAAYYVGLIECRAAALAAANQPEN